MVDETRRKILKTGAAAAAMAAVPPAPRAAERTSRARRASSTKGQGAHPLQEWGSGFPLMLISGGGLGGSTIGGLTNPFDAVGEFKGEYRCIGADLRTANSGQSTGPLEVDRPWDAFADDQIGLMDHLGIDKFMVMGFCIGGPLIWNLLKRAPNRVVAAVLAQPSGCRAESADADVRHEHAGLGTGLRQAPSRRDDGAGRAVPDEDVQEPTRTSSGR